MKWRSSKDHRISDRTRNDKEQYHAKKGMAVDNYLKDCKFSGFKDVSFDEKLADFNICSRIPTLTDSQHFEFFVYTLDCAARSHFLNKCLPDMPFKYIEYAKQYQYSSLSRKQQFLDHIPYLNLSQFM